MPSVPEFFYPDLPAIPLPAGHRFPASKYALLREAVERDRVLGGALLKPSPQASRADLLRAHDAAYIEAVIAGKLDAVAMRRIGLPWSEMLVERSLATTGCAVASARAALRHGVSGQLAGGTHHAHRDFGSGFCVFNDLAVAALTLLDDGVVERIAIIDTDVHQGDGTAAILGHDARAFLLSVQGERNFPFRRVPGTLDVELPDGTEDEAYIAALAPALEQAFAFRPNLVLYLAGADPLREDRLGRLALTLEGLAARDEMVLGRCAKLGVPVAIAAGGGYAEPIALSVAAYLGTFRTAARAFGLGTA